MQIRIENEGFFSWFWERHGIIAIARTRIAENSQIKMFKVRKEKSSKYTFMHNSFSL